MSRIFISYKRVDKDKVFKIKDQIEATLGEKCWIDLDGIESDAQFKNVIIKAINECEIVLFMYSKAHSKIVDFENDWTIRELDFAKDKDKRIVFVNIDGSPLTDEFKFDYGRKQQIQGSSTDSILRLCKDLEYWKTHPYNRATLLITTTKKISKKLKWLVLVILVCVCGILYFLTKNVNSPDTLEIKDIIATYIEATKEPYLVPWGVFSNNKELIPISTSIVKPDDWNDDFGYPFMFQYKAKLQYNHNPIMVNGMKVPLTWDINLYGPHAGVSMIELYSGDMSGFDENGNIWNLASDLGFVLKEDNQEGGMIRQTYQKEEIMMFITINEGTGGRYYDIVVTNSFNSNPQW